MSAGQHTPAPWKFQDGKEGIIASGERLKTAGRTKLAIANRALIAAAPELLEAVIALIVTGDSGYGTPTDKAWEMAEAALAKATGKEGS